MDFRERRDQQPEVVPHPDIQGDVGEGTAHLREEGELFLAAADDAINRALSRNSSEFLAQNRQQGGQ